MPDVVKIVKVGGEASAPAHTTRKGGRHIPGHRHKIPQRSALKGGRTVRAKIEAVRDPSKSPPVRKSTLRILTDKGVERRRKRISKTVRAMPDDKVRHILEKSGMRVSKHTPPKLAKEILEGGMEAGMIVSP